MNKTQHLLSSLWNQHASFKSKVWLRSVLNAYPVKRRLHLSHWNNCHKNISSNVQRLFKGLEEGRRSSLAEAITLVESSNENDKCESHVLLSLVLDRANNKLQKEGNNAVSFRIGLSGPPGAGKSTFIESFGKLLTNQGHKLAVLAIDPSSATTGGSLMGDKTRMPELTRNPNAYIRPSPNRCQLGGVSKNTTESIMLCECAGYNIIIVETVGVGQAEHCVADMVDMLCLLIPPAGGDELQGIKRGIIELCDLIIVTKSDGDLEPAARRIHYEYTSAMKYIRQRSNVWKPKVQRVSCVTNKGIIEVWDTIQSFFECMLSNKELLSKRRSQQITSMWSHISNNFMLNFKKNADVNKQLISLENQVAKGILPPNLAADILLKAFFSK